MEEMESTVNFYSKEYAEQLYGHEPGEQIVLKIMGRVRSISIDGATVDIESCSVIGEASSFSEAADRAKKETDYVRNHMEPSVG